MNVYVVARFYEKDEVRRIYKLLRAKGHAIATDWTLHKNIKPYTDHPGIARDYSIEDIDGVKNCDVFIMLTSQEIGSGSSTELGAAIIMQSFTSKPKIYIVGPHFAQNFAYFHPAVERRETLGEVLGEL
jgi:hypothetical protein